MSVSVPILLIADWAVARACFLGSGHSPAASGSRLTCPLALPSRCGQACALVGAPCKGCAQPARSHKWRWRAPVWAPRRKASQACCGAASLLALAQRDEGVSGALSARCEGSFSRPLGEMRRGFQAPLSEMRREFRSLSARCEGSFSRPLDAKGVQSLSARCEGSFRCPLGEMRRRLPPCESRVRASPAPVA